jgi:hypothetical protein
MGGAKVGEIRWKCSGWFRPSSIVVLVYEFKMNIRCIYVALNSWTAMNSFQPSEYGVNVKSLNHERTLQSIQLYPVGSEH